MCDECKFLGNVGYESIQVEPEKTETQRKIDTDEKIGTLQTEDSMINFCSSCNIKMLHTTTKFKINGWSGPHPKLPGDGLGEEFLPVTVYLCPKCAKIEFKAASAHIKFKKQRVPNLPLD